QKIQLGNCEAVDPGKRRHVLKCNYCGKDFSGGIFRIKNRLAHTRKDSSRCEKVPPEVKQLFISYINFFENNKEKCEESGALDGEYELGVKEKLMKDVFDRTKTPNTINSYYKKPGKDDACIAICDFFMQMRCLSMQDLTRAASTRFFTNYLNLKSFHVLKVTLRKMFTSEAWKKIKYAKEKLGKKVQEIVLGDANFWLSIISCLKSVTPLVKGLRFAIDRAKEQIQINFKNVRSRYIVYTDIIELRWNTQLHGPPHAAGYILLISRKQLLFYALYYSPDFDANIDIKKGFYDVVTRMCSCLLMQGMSGHAMAKDTRDKKYPALWWNSYEDSAPELQRVVFCVLSATCSATSQQRLNALVYVKYNLQLNERFTKMQEQEDSYDPICLSDMEPRNLSTMKLAQGKGSNKEK
ncbi:hypothetical protein MKX03_003074, partial [Papaver bracteatum]